MFNMVQAYATRDRVPVCGLSNQTPTADDILNIPDTAYLPSDSDEKDLKLELSYMVARILAAHMVCFAEFDDASQWKILHPYNKESSVKSEIVPLGILQFYETKTAEMIHILDNYGQYAPQDKDGKPLPFVLYCDGLSCERADGAQRARINGGDHWARLEMIEPAIQEWHRRLMFVQDTFDELFKFESHREKGTLYNIKQYFDHKGVSSNIMECFNKATELLHFATKGFTVVAAMDLLGVQSVDATPDALPSTASDRRDFLMSLAADIVNMIYEKTNTMEILEDEPAQGDFQYCSCKMDIGGVMVYCSYTKCRKGQWFHIDWLGISLEDVPEGDWFCSEDCKSLKNSGKKKSKSAISDRFRDLKNEYAHRLLWRGLNDLARADAVSENDGTRMIRHWKFDLMEFYEKHHPKYFVYAHRLLTNVGGAVSERLQH